MTRSVMMLGGPDSGKTNYVGRLWPALDAVTGALHAAIQPDDLTFVLEIAEHLFQGHFAPRTEHSDGRRAFEVTVAAEKGGAQTRVVIPDMSGELWRNAVVEGELPAEWMSELRGSDGALLFVRVGSDQDVRPLDWVTSRRLLQKVGVQGELGLPTQVMLCELIRFLEISLADRPEGGRPRLSVVVAAWDLVDVGEFAAGPVAYLEREYPLAAGRLRDTDRLDVKLFGLSVVGGDLKADANFRDAYLDKGLDGHGWVAVQDDNGGWRKEPDVTIPVAWVVGD